MSATYAASTSASGETPDAYNALQQAREQILSARGLIETRVLAQNVTTGSEIVTTCNALVSQINTLMFTIQPREQTRTASAGADGMGRARNAPLGLGNDST